MHCARVLAKKVSEEANATVSPWPFRTFAQTGAVRTADGHIGELYSAHVIWNIQLLDAIVAIPDALSSTDVAAVKSARSVAWEWLVKYPLSNNHWCGYCEDLTTAGLDWIDGKCDYDSITFRLTSRYLMGVPVAGGSVLPNGGAGTGTPVAWQTAVPKMLRWVEDELIFWTKPGAGSPPVQYGARCVSEQRDDPNRMSCHTSSYASVLAQYSEALTKHQLNATAAADAAENAKRSWAWASYSLVDTGNIHVTPGQGETDAWFTVSIDTLMNTMVLIGAMPEVGTPDDQTHIVRTTTVLRDVRYAGSQGDELVSYDASDAVSIEKVRVQSDALTKGITVLLDDSPLERIGSALEVSGVAEKAGKNQSMRRGAWSLDEATGVVEVARANGGRVALIIARKMGG